MGFEAQGRIQRLTYRTFDPGAHQTQTRASLATAVFDTLTLQQCARTLVLLQFAGFSPAGSLPMLDAHTVYLDQ